MEYDKEFIKPEWRSEYYVDETMKKVWWVQMTILQDWGKWCDDHHLRWFVYGGALIGAIRHHGFVPWDDDIDVCMPREDYNKMLELWKTEGLKEPYFLQTTLTDEDCYQFWTSIRRSDTTGNRISLMNKRCHNGIAIDVMPFDGCENNLLLYRIRRFPLKVVSTICNTYVNEFNMSRSARILRKIVRLFKIDYRKAYIWLEKKNSKHTWDKYDQVTLTLVANPDVKSISERVWKKEDFDHAVYVDFEHIKIPVPCGYDRILKMQYHDYMKLPPVEKRKGKHEMIYEPDIPYKKYCSEHYGVTYADQE